MSWRAVVAVVPAVLGLVIFSAPAPVQADCGLDPPRYFLARPDPRYPMERPITHAFFGRVVATIPGIPEGNVRPKHYLVRVDRQLAGKPMVTREFDISARWECGEVDLADGRTYLFALTDLPADFNRSFVLGREGGRWISLTQASDRTTYLLDAIKQTPRELAAGRIPTATSALIRFLQRKLGPLPDTATQPVAAAVETLPLNPLLLVLAGAGGAFLGRRLKRDRDRAQSHAV